MDTLQKISADELIDQPVEEVIDAKVIYTSDGKLRNEVIAKKTVKYQVGDSSLYIFPEGLRVNSFKDSIPESDLVADSATLRDDRSLFFTAIGNVVARNIITKKRLETDGPLYWNQKNKTIETNVYTEVYTETDTIYAKYGLFSDDQFKEVEMRGQSGVVFKEFGKRTGGVADSTGVLNKSGAEQSENIINKKSE
ncbi:MAG: LPS export ABC transporter periplasmic protein LptC [Prevotellaceae bacterium]|jgi:hypothetical protein|nr:LPS export ABC transporter periplasmic protein LptC [Prevotellaceae bacterium]